MFIRISELNLTDTEKHLYIILSMGYQFLHFSYSQFTLWRDCFTYILDFFIHFIIMWMEMNSVSLEERRVVFLSVDSIF